MMSDATIGCEPYLQALRKLYYMETLTPNLPEEHIEPYLDLMLGVTIRGDLVTASKMRNLLELPNFTLPESPSYSHRDDVWW